VRTLIDHEMLQQVIPEGTVLRDVFLEIHDGHVTYGRQIGTYPILVGLPYDVALNRFVNVRVTSHGQRSLTAIEYPLDVNHAPLAAICALPGIGEKRAARIVRARPFDSWPAFAASLDDPAVAQRGPPSSVSRREAMEAMGLTFAMQWRLTLFKVNIRARTFRPTRVFLSSFTRWRSHRSTRNMRRRP